MNEFSPTSTGRSDRRSQLDVGNPDRSAGEAANDKEHDSADHGNEDQAREAAMARLRPLAAAPAPTGDQQRIGLRAAPATAARRTHAKRPSARSAACARRRR